MIHRPWPYAQRFLAAMADSSIQDSGIVMTPRMARTDGLHASTLLRKLYPVKGSKITEDELAVFGLLGLAFEDRAELALAYLATKEDWPFHAERPGEITTQDGYVCSPDILLTSKEGDPRPREVSLKCTWKSCNGLPIDGEDENGFPPKFDYYIGQAKTYARAMHSTEAILAVYFVCGGWKPPVPQFLAWELEFSHQELEEERDALLTISCDGME